MNRVRTLDGFALRKPIAEAPRHVTMSCTFLALFCLHPYLKSVPAPSPKERMVFGLIEGLFDAKHSNTVRPDNRKRGDLHQLRTGAVEKYQMQKHCGTLKLSHSRCTQKTQSEKINTTRIKGISSFIFFFWSFRKKTTGPLKICTSTQQQIYQFK